MKQIDQTVFSELLSEANIQPRLREELRFVASTAHLVSNADWEMTELLAITDRNAQKKGAHYCAR